MADTTWTEGAMKGELTRVINLYRILNPISLHECVHHDILLLSLVISRRRCPQQGLCLIHRGPCGERRYEYEVSEHTDAHNRS